MLDEPVERYLFEVTLAVLFWVGVIFLGIRIYRWSDSYSRGAEGRRREALRRDIRRRARSLSGEALRRREAWVQAELKRQVERESWDALMGGGRSFELGVDDYEDEPGVYLNEAQIRVRANLMRWE